MSASLPLAPASPLASAPDPGFALYIHWPFCAAKCPYCDFNSHVRESVDHHAWAEALLGELDYWADRTPGRTLTSIFFGGGTPSLMQPRTVERLIDKAARRWHLPDDAEITLEANPTSVEAERFQGFRVAGVNRVSLGIQSLRDADLRLLGRRHDAAEARQAIAVARRFFPRYSFDLIYARPGQTPAAWQEEMQWALNEAADHLSLYQLTIEEGTRFHTLHARGELVLPDEDVQADLYAATEALLAENGLLPYEISNYARRGSESRHNLVYWRYGDYIGIGPGAHGRVSLPDGKVATRNHRAPEIWLERVQRLGSGCKPHEALSAAEQAQEMLMMGLRLAEGVCRARLRALGPAWLDTTFERRLDALVRQGMVQCEGERLCATAEGRLRLNAVLARLLA
jgi:putative oxygen-independent coproporphyrinogen III oxidase